VAEPAPRRLSDRKKLNGRPGPLHRLVMRAVTYFGGAALSSSHVASSTSLSINCSTAQSFVGPALA
jgi:hypothetical protein